MNRFLVTGEVLVSTGKDFFAMKRLNIEIQG